MIHAVEILPEWVEKARLLADELGTLRNSIRGGEGNLVGFIGEEMVCHYLGAIRANTYDYDVLIGDHRIDVKTKATTANPLYSYNATVANFNITQDCDYYYFVRVDKSLTIGWLLGGLPKDMFYQLATFGKKGQPDPDSPVGWTFKADCYNIKLSQLLNNKLDACYC